MQNDIDLLFEIGTMRYVERTWKQFLSADFANNAEHSFRVAWIALMLAKMESKDQPIDTGKLLKIALLHDLAETRTGDVNYLSRQYTQRNDDLAVNDIFTETCLDEMKELWAEYVERKTIEAKIVKDADNLDVDMELAEQASKGNTVKDEWQYMREGAVVKNFYTESAKHIWNEIQVTSPHRWHLKSRNRFNAGDWKQDKS